MLDFNCGVEGIPMINLTKDEVEVHYLPHQGNIAEDPEDDIEMPTAAPGPSTHQPIAHGGLSKTPVPPADQQLFFPQPIGRLEALMSKENRTLTLIKVGREEASTCFNAHASQDEASYDGDVSDAEGDIEVIPDEVVDTQVESSKPVGAVSTAKKFKRLPTRAVAAKPQSLQTRTQLVNTATRLHLEHEIILSVRIEASSQRDARTNIQRTTFQCTVSSGQVVFL